MRKPSAGWQPTPRYVAVSQKCPDISTAGHIAPRPLR
jgi:hypothetical protein